MSLFRWIAIFNLVLAPLTVHSDEVTFEPVWAVKAGAAIYGGIGSDATRVYAGGENGVLHAINKATGKTDWKYDADAAIASAVSADERRVYFHTRAGRVHALDKKDGNPLWAFASAGERRWDYWDYYLSTPVADDRQVYFGSGDHHVYALEKHSGQLRWKVRTGNIVHGTPALSGEKVFVGGFDGRMYAIDRGTGQTLWTFKTVGTDYFRNGEIPGSATVSDGRVYFGGRDYNIYALLEDTGTGAWNDRTPSWIVGKPLVVDDELIVVNSDYAGVFSYNRRSGKQNWAITNSYNMFAGAELLGAAHLAIAGLDGRITIVSRKDGGIAGVFETEATRAARPRFFQADGHLDYAGVESLEDLMDLYERQMRQMGGISGRIVVDGEVIYYATVSGEIAAIRVSGTP